MVDMNQTSFGPGTGSDPQQAPPPPHHDLDRLRRSTSDRYIAGVAGGLGRHFNLDPTVIRVLLAVLTLFGGAGVLLYAVCWAFVPEEGKDKANIKIGSDARKILLLAAAGVAVLIAMGDAFSGFSAGWMIASVAVVVGVIMIARDRKNERNAASAPPPPPPPPAYTVTDPSLTPAAATGYPPTEGFDAPPAPPAWQPPVLSPPILPPHPKRTGILWFWPTLALIAIALGIVGIIDSGSTQVPVGVYPAIALAITGVTLLVGSFYGRPGGLILVGVVSTITLTAATVLGSFNFDGRNLEAAPTSAATVESEYQTHMGRIELDLTKVSDPQNLAGREIELHLNAGEIVVIVPRSLNLDIDAAMGFAGGITIPGYDGGGFEDSAEKHVVGIPASTSEPLELDLDVRVGQITVEQR